MAWRGQISKNIKELRFLMCQSSPASSSARAFVEKNYKELKTLNPKLPILIRECKGVEPQLWARYDLGVEKGIKLEGLTEQQISKTLEDLIVFLFEISHIFPPSIYVSDQTEFDPIEFKLKVLVKHVEHL
ncbi:hypothetical protein Lal_00008316 [Lupinus albus]|nr:hypothetical protein Lal_00008316 [Lupinus albus]